MPCKISPLELPFTTSNLMKKPGQYWNNLSVLFLIGVNLSNSHLYIHIPSATIIPYQQKPCVAKDHYTELNPYYPKCPVIPVYSSRVRCFTQSLHFQNWHCSQRYNKFQIRKRIKGKNIQRHVLASPPPQKVALGRHRAHSFLGFGSKVFTFPKVGFHQMARVF